VIDLRNVLPTNGRWGPRSRTEAIVIHHSATPPNTTPTAIATYHVTEKRYPGCAYHYLVYADGETYQCNDEDRLLWHAGCGYDDPRNANAYSLAVCLVGDFTTQAPPQGQLQAARQLVGDLRARYGTLTVLGHRDAYGVSTSCPGDTYTEWLPFVAGGRGEMLTTLHCQRVLPWMDSVLAEWRSGWVKVVNPPADVSFPDVPRVLGRIWTDDVDGGYLARGREGGAAFVRDMAPRWRAVPEVRVWELANEPDCNSTDGLARLREYTLGAIEEANRQGITLCVLNLPEGNPGGDAAAIRWKWQQLAEAVKAAVAGGHYVGLHAYWRPGVEGPTGRYHALGRREYDICDLADMGVDVDKLRVLINECGIDGGIAGHTPRQGWRDLSTPEIYREEIAEAEEYARGMPAIDALMYFTAGFEPPWGGYDIDEWFARSCTPVLRAVADEGGYVIPSTSPEPNLAEITAAQLEAARKRLSIFPASMKACHNYGLQWCGEWWDGDRLMVLAYDTLEGYLVLRLDPRTWTAEAEARL